MVKGITEEIKNRIESANPGTVFVTSDFADIASLTTIRQCLGRLVKAGLLVRAIDGVYSKPVYSTLIKEYIPAHPDDVAKAIARNFHWTISPSGAYAANLLGLSTQVPAVWSYISDGPYREYSIGNNKISFKHRTNREISGMSEITILVIEALKDIGKTNIDDTAISRLRHKLSAEDKETLLKESTSVSEWVYDVIRKVCLINE